MHRPAGVSTCCVPDPGRGLFDSFARAGVACAELSLDGSAYADFPWEECARWSRDSGVGVRSFHLPFHLGARGWLDPSSADPGVRRAAGEEHRRCLAAAAVLGSRLLVVHASAEPLPGAGTPERAERLARAKESMAELAEAAAAEGMTVCVEDLPRSCLGNTAAELAEIVGADPRLRVCFDTNHLLLGSHAEFFALLGPRIATLHVSDYDFVNERHWLPGEGKIDWRAFADGLDAAGYDGPLVYELRFAGDPRTVARDRDLVPEDLVLNAREIEERADLTVHGRGGLPGLPLWP